MAGTRLTFAVDKAELERLRVFMDEQAARDTSGLMPRLGEYLLESTQKRFKDQVKPDGTKWAELNERYARRKKYNKDKILTLRGYLRSYLSYRIPNPQTLELGSNQKYAAIHQLGGTIEQLAQSRKVRYRSVAGRVLFAKAKHVRGVAERWVARGAYQVKIPARPFLGISTADDQEIREIILDWVVGRK
jgi:phage virion morphogenesis protein